MIKQSQRTNVGVGLYTFAEAARLLRTPLATVRRWVSSRNGIVARSFAADEQFVSLMELVELHVVKLLRGQAVSVATIRKVARTAAVRFGIDHPFATHRFDTDGHALITALLKAERKASAVEDLSRALHAFDSIVRPFFKQVEYGQGGAVRFWPRGKKHRIVLDSQRKFGAPIDAPTGVPTAALYRAVCTGDDPSQVAAWFGVPLEAVHEAVNFEQSLVA